MKLSKMKKTRTPARRTVDMSPEAIDQRLRELGQLYELGVEIRSAQWLGTLKELEESSAKRGSAPVSPSGKGT